VGINERGKEKIIEGNVILTGIYNKIFPHHIEVWGNEERKK
jgi:hypothetical protein